METDAGTLIDNPLLHRFEWTVDGHTAFVAYETTERGLTLSHTEVPKVLAGRGIGSALARAVFDELRRRKQRVAVTCLFLLKVLAQQPEYKDILLD